MCAPVIVTEENANDLITQPGNPHLIWDGAEARVITEDFYRALNAEARVQYDTAKRFISQSQEALRAKNLVFARSLADKAAALAAQLAGK